MAKLTGDEREIILNALKESGVGQKDLKGISLLSDVRLIKFADATLNNADEEADDEDVEDEELDDEEVDDDSEESEDDEDEPTGNEESDEEEFDEDEDFEDDEELVDNEEFEDEVEAVNNGCGSGMKKKKKKGATMNRELTAQEWLDLAPPEVAEVVNNAMAHARDQKAELIEKLTVNLSGEKKKVMIRKLANNSLDELKDMMSLVGSTPATPKTRPQPRQAIYAGAGGVTANSKSSQERKSEPLIPPTINFADLSKEFGNSNG